MRLAALRTVVALFTALGTEGLALLPSALPYLSELMEDNDGGVVTAAHRAVRKVLCCGEAVVGVVVSVARSLLTRGVWLCAVGGAVWGEFAVVSELSCEMIHLKEGLNSPLVNCGGARVDNTF